MGKSHKINTGAKIAKSIRKLAVVRWIRPRITRRNVVLTCGAVLVLLIVAYLAVFFWPRTVTFSYARDNCITNPTFLPQLISKNQSATYTAAPRPSLSLLGAPLYAHTTCITPRQPPAEQSKEAIGFGTGIFTKNITVAAGEYPSLANEDAPEGPVPTQDPLRLELDTPDRIFDYHLQADGKSTTCAKTDRELLCDVAELNLTQSKTYDFTLERLFDGSPVQVVFARPLRTVESVRITETSIAPDQTVYDKPGELTLTLNRAVVSAEDARLYLVAGDTREELPIKTEVKDDVVTIRFEEPLPRQKSFLFTVERVVAGDGGFLPEPLSLSFTTSGGPQVRGVNIGGYGVPRGSNIVLTFDAPVSEEQRVDKFVRLEANGEAVAASLSVRGSTLIINPHNALPRCAPLTVRVLDGLENVYGVSGGSAWQYQSRALCQVVFSIGTSVQGRNITAYRFGDGSSAVVFVGGMHGNEKSSVHTLNSWINQLEANPGRIPGNRTIVVIPNANPDGFVANNRYNANGVDLNRNFPTHDWKPDVTFGDGTHLPQGGGSAPLSEPESRALADYVLGLSPRLVLTYHSIAGYVIPNNSGDSDALARTYAEHSDLHYASHDQTDELFPYDTTGAFEDWLHDKHDLPALLIELWTRDGYEYTANQNAMWRMVEL
jgi:hypothetical protein